MEKKSNKHVAAFEMSKLKPGEEILAHLEGWIGEVMGSGDKTQHNGQLFLTSTRVCFYRKGIFGEVLETIPLEKLSSVEMLTNMGYKVIRLHTSNDELAFKTFESKEFFDEFYGLLESRRHGERSAERPTISIADELAKMVELKLQGIITDDEFHVLKAKVMQ